MNNHQPSTLKLIFSKPLPKSLEWSRIESLLNSVGAAVIEGSGSRVRFDLNGVIATFIALTPTNMPSPTRFAMRACFWSRQE